MLLMHGLALNGIHLFASIPRRHDIPKTLYGFMAGI
jgi:hypothetical protein